MTIAGVGTVAVVAYGLGLGHQIPLNAERQTPSRAVAAPAPQAPIRPVSPLAATSGLPDLSSVAEAALQVSANISSTTMVRRQLDPFFAQFFGDQVEPSQSLGSGVVVSSDGYVLTNKHVIGSAGADIKVTLPYGRELPGKLVGIDDVSDLAVVKVAATGLSTLPWGDSSKLRVAEWVLAVGNPFQLSGTVTLGIVSTVARSAEQVGAYQDFIQTDAAINPGNSGGALINAQGELVGINTMIYSQTGGYQGIGFAIPSVTARKIMDELIQNGEVRWGSIGEIRWINIDRNMAERYNLGTTGAYVRSISSTSPAYRAGLEPGDTVVKINGQAVSDADQVMRAVIRASPGTSIKLEVLKQNGRPATLTVPIVPRQGQSVRSAR